MVDEEAAVGGVEDLELFGAANGGWMRRDGGGSGVRKEDMVVMFVGDSDSSEDGALGDDEREGGGIGDLQGEWSDG